MRLEGVVLGRNLVVVEVADEGHLLQDVGLDAGNAVEEEDGEDAGGGAEGGADGAPVVAGMVRMVCSWWIGSVGWVVLLVVKAYILRRALGVYWPSLSLGML